MRVGPGLLVGVIAICALAATARAQPFPDRDAPDDPRADVGGARTRMPLTVPDDPEVMDAGRTGASTVPAPISLEQPIDPDRYICGPGDGFELNFWGRQNFRLKIAADLEGRAFISKVGYVEVAGKSLTAVRALITQKVRGPYPGLRFDLTLVEPRSFLVHVVDNVARPGTYRAYPTERVAAVLARAGGITGSRRAIEIRRRDGAQVAADLVRYELTGEVDHNPFVLDGDVIRVPFAGTVVTVAGAIRRPGSYELTTTKDLAELLELAGGLTSAAARSLPIKLIRRNAQQRSVARDLPYGSAGALPIAALRDDDAITVRGADELARTVLLIGAVTGAEALDAAATSRRLDYVEGDTVLSLLQRAGGIRAPGDLARSYISRIGKAGEFEAIPVDLDALLTRRELAADHEIQLGDTIVVPPMRHSILVEGAVGRAGLYTYNPRFGIAEYVAHAGGRTRTARGLDEIKLIRPSGAVLSYKAGLRLSPGDAILVPERSFTRAEVVQVVIAVTGLVLSGVAITIAATR